MASSGAAGKKPGPEANFVTPTRERNMESNVLTVVLGASITAVTTGEVRFRFCSFGTWGTGGWGSSMPPPGG